MPVTARVEEGKARGMKKVRHEPKVDVSPGTGKPEKEMKIKIKIKIIIIKKK